MNREELAAVCFLAHQLGKKVYVTVNIYARDSDMKTLPAFLQYLSDIQVDGLIVSDPGILSAAVRWAPGIPIHLSTQANSTNSAAIEFWQDQGVRRVNLARELSFSEIAEISKNTGVELELFIHGAMCVSYSGRCLLSAYLNQRSANRGLCTQPCRWSYRLVEEKRPGQYFPVYEDPKGTYIFNSRDLCLLDDLGKLMELGIRSFKIEGRMKGALYLASVLRGYRKAIDTYWQAPGDYRVHAEWRDDLQRVSHRPYTKGFLFPENDSTLNEISASVPYVQTHTLAGIVRQMPAPFRQGKIPFSHAAGNTFIACMEVRSRLVQGTELQFLFPDGRTELLTLEELSDLDGNRLQTANPNSWIRVPVPFAVFPMQIVSQRISDS